MKKEEIDFDNRAYLKKDYSNNKNNRKYNTFQDYVVKTIHSVLSNLNYLGDQNLYECRNFKYIVNAIVTHYAATYKIIFNDKPKNGYYIDDHYVNLWQTANLKNKKEIIVDYYKSILMTEDTANRLSDGKIYKDNLHLEHITPNSLILRRLKNLLKDKKGESISDADIKDCFKQHVVILITKEESNLLDGKSKIALDKKMKANAEAYVRLQYLNNISIKKYGKEIKLGFKDNPNSFCKISEIIEDVNDNLMKVTINPKDKRDLLNFDKKYGLEIKLKSTCPLHIKDYFEKNKYEIDIN